MSSALERYEKLGLRESLSRSYDYASACRELSCFLKEVYKKVPKNLQNIMFQDTLAAFRLLPDSSHTSRGVSAANFLLQAAEVALPKQKKTLAVTEFKHAIVAHKRRSKGREDGQGSAQLPQDVLVLIFGFLDMRSLAAVGLVCRSWNSAASDNMLWQSQYALFFDKSDKYCESKDKFGKHAPEKMNVISRQKKEVMDPVIDLDWREAFKRAYIGKSLWRSTSNRGYCKHCKSIIWLSNMSCTSLHHTSKDEKRPWKIKPMSSHQVVDYLLGDPLSDMSSSDSDSDSDWQPWLPKLWAYSRHIGTKTNG